MTNEVRFCYVDAGNVITAIGRTFVANTTTIFASEAGARVLEEGEPEVGDLLVNGKVIKTTPMTIDPPVMLEVGQELTVPGLPDGAQVEPPPGVMDEPGSFTYVVTAPGYRKRMFTVTVVPPTFMPISDRQFGTQLAIEGVVTQEEALAFVQQGVIPPALLTIVDAIADPAQRFEAAMLVSGATEFRRDHPLVDLVRAELGWTSARLDEFWRAAAQK